MGVLVQTAPGAAVRTLEPDLQQVMAFERLGEQYELEVPLGAGGMGVVVAARHRLLGHSVAIKVLRPSLKLHHGAEQRFLVEAKSGARLSSPHVARVLDGGLAPGGLPYLVMERLEGLDGERHLSTQGVPTIAETLDVMVQVLEALSEAHASGLVHRDLKPANLFLKRGPTGRLSVKVLDFGLAKVMGENLGLTASQGFLGSPLYVAPEQLRQSSDIDARADVWGVGCLLYRFLTGRVPFPAGSVAEVVTRIQRDDPTPVNELRPEIPEALASLVAQLLEKNPLKRPASVAEVGLRLRPLVSGVTANDLDALLLRSPGLTAVAPAAVARPLRRYFFIPAVAGAALAGIAVGWALPRPERDAVLVAPAPAPPPLVDRTVEARPPERAAPRELEVSPAPPLDVEPPPAVSRPKQRLVARPVAPKASSADAGSEDPFDGRE